MKAAAQEIQERCQFNKKAIIWFDARMVRYSNQDFFGIPETYTGYLMWNNRNSTESSSRRDAGALALIYELVQKASNSERMFEPREVRVAYYEPNLPFKIRTNLLPATHAQIRYVDVIIIEKFITL